MDNMRDQRNCKWNREPEFAPGLSLFMRSLSCAIEEEDEAEAKLNSIQKGYGTVCLCFHYVID